MPPPRPGQYAPATVGGGGGLRSEKTIDRTWGLTAYDDLCARRPGPAVVGVVVVGGGCRAGGGCGGIQPRHPPDFHPSLQRVPRRREGGRRRVVRCRASGPPRPAKSGRVPIVPGDPARSELLRRVRSADPDEVMPPPKHGPPLAAAEIGMIERWIAQGAEWQRALGARIPARAGGAGGLRRVVAERAVRPLRVAAPRPRRNSSPRPRRRPRSGCGAPAFDLTGLPPTPEEAGGVRSGGGEGRAGGARAGGGQPVRLAAVWRTLGRDVARSGALFGHLRLRKGPAPRHLAVSRLGDPRLQLGPAVRPIHRSSNSPATCCRTPRPTSDLATAFHRNTQCNTEGGTDDEEFRLAAVIDRVNTTWTDVAGHHLRLRAVPLPPLRPDPARGILPFRRVLQQHAGLRSGRRLSHK